MSNTVQRVRAVVIGVLMVAGAYSLVKPHASGDTVPQTSEKPAGDPRAAYETVTLARIQADTDTLAARGVWTNGILFSKGNDFFLKSSAADNSSVAANLADMGADLREKIITNCQGGCPVKVAGMVTVHGGILVDAIKQD